MNDNMTPADLKAVLGNNNSYPYPVYANGGNSGFGGDAGWLWIFLIIAMMGGWGGMGFGGMGFGGFGGMYEFPWLLTGQNGINNNTNDGFNNLHLSNQLNGISSGVQNLATQLCNCCGDISQNLCNGFAGVNATVNSGFANAETAANSRQMANMQQAFNSQIATLQGFNDVGTQICGVGSQIAENGYENRLATCQTQNIVQNESNATRFADANNTRDIITNATQNTQAILDKLCQLELDGVKSQVEAKNDRIAELQSQLTMRDFQISQTAQNALISQGFANEVDQLYNRLNNCPVPSTPVYGRTPIFTCNNGCGCNGNGNFI